MNPSVIGAIFKRNFVSYFSSPTGYVFICVFVLLIAFAAFWPNEFFNTNLANLDQLNKYLPLILLIFIPAITMSVWAEERRQGTDELLLTLPATDLDVVLGKYLAAVAIYTVSLLFSLWSIVDLYVLGDPDLRLLLLGNYIGYWLVGLAMLSVGMVASFLTANLTVGFILGLAFNAPLVFLASADVLSGLFGQFTGLFNSVFNTNLPSGPEVAIALGNWSIASQFRDFGIGVISFSSVLYFALIIVCMLYLSMILIGRRHWQGDTQPMAVHYSFRVLALLGVAVAAVMLISRANLRMDITAEGVNSLSPRTEQLLASMEGDRAVRIDAYISPVVPESYVQTRLDLISRLREFGALGGDRVQVQIHPTEPYSENAQLADEQFGIRAQQVASRNRGAMNIEQIFLGVAITSGLNQVVIPFVDRGVPVEYELIRSIATVTGQERRRIGVLTTDAQLYGSVNMQSMSPGQNELIIDELEKQYEVVQVNADQPITEDYDVLLAVQPSSLGPDQMQNFVAAVRSGQPTAIFEDPFPYLSDVPGTTMPRRSPQQMMPFMQQQQPPAPKGDIRLLWQTLGAELIGSDTAGQRIPGNEVVWQNYNPYPKVGEFPPEFVFTDQGEMEADSRLRAFNAESPITSGIEQMLFLFPGGITKRATSSLEYTELIITGRRTGVVRVSDIMQQSFLGMRLNESRQWIPTGKSYTMAAWIRGPVPSDAPLAMSDEGLPAADSAPMEDEPGSEAATPQTTESAPAEPAPEEAPATTAAQPEINVVFCADIDMLFSAFFALRTRGDDPDSEINLRLDNVNFVLNTLDVLAGDERFIEIRSRRPRYRTLSKFEALTAEARERATEEREKFKKQFEAAKEKEQLAFDRRIAELESRDDIDRLQKELELNLARERGQRRLEGVNERLSSELEAAEERIKREETSAIRQQQDTAKLWAILKPPIPPLILGLIVYFNRRVREREGVSKQRLR